MDELGVGLCVGDEGAAVTDVAYLPTGGLEARGFLAPVRSANERLSPVLDLLRLMDKLDEDRE